MACPFTPSQLRVLSKPNAVEDAFAILRADRMEAMRARGRQAQAGALDAISADGGRVMNAPVRLASQKLAEAYVDWAIADVVKRRLPYMRIRQRAGQRRAAQKAGELVVMCALMLAAVLAVAWIAEQTLAGGM